MAWFQDLSPCDYFGESAAPMLAVGWLERGKPLATGTVDPHVFAKLRDFCSDPWQPSISAGVTILLGKGRALEIPTFQGALPPRSRRPLRWT